MDSPFSSGWITAATTAKWAGWLLIVLAGLLYLATLDTGLRPGELEGGDLITHQYAQVQARPGNAPGYPLYTLGGWLWFHGWRGLLRLGGDALPNPMPILSSYSTLWALLALWLFYQILRRLSRSHHWPHGHWPLAWLISAFYAVTYFFWYYATTTEQYSSAVAHTLAILWVYLIWEEQTKDDGRPTADRRPQTADGALRTSHFTLHTSQFTIFFLAFLCGLTLAHMVTVAMIVPPLVAVVLWRDPGLLRRPLSVIGAVMAAALPLFSYIYVYVRGAAHPEWWGEGNWQSGSDWFWHFVRTSQGQEELSWGLQPGAPFFGNGFPHLIWQELSIPLLMLGLVGIAMLSPTTGRGRLHVLLYATLLFYVVLCWIDRFGNWFQIILPAYPLVLLGLMPMALWSMDRLRRRWRWAVIVPPLLLAAAILWRVDASLPAANSRQRADDTALQQSLQLLDQPLPGRAALFSEKEVALGLDYLINIWGIRPDLRVVSSPQADSLLDAGEVVLATTTAAALLQSEIAPAQPLALDMETADRVRFAAVGNETHPATSLARPVGDGIVLAGYTRQGDQITLDREATRTAGDWALSVRPLHRGALMLNSDGAPLQEDSPAPVRGLRPFSSFVPGQRVRDSYHLPTLPAPDALQIILYRTTESGFENLSVTELPLPTE